MTQAGSQDAKSRGICPGSLIAVCERMMSHHQSVDALVLASASPRRRELLGALGALFRPVATDVVVAELTDDEIDAYVATGEPMDKAGAYGIQGLGGRLVRAVAGSYTCVVGLPLVAVHRLLVDAGMAGLNDPTDTYLRWLEAQGKEPLPCPPTFP